ncbi:hypothetical protein OG280_08890 [Streptomyces virginiae]|uniref:hypothetical protein n=1 Tax=Streptomyces virginiae TaxID=1961 RepID=UPI002DDBCDBB|nr:hypothetical protein [Streptomyces virginiae]WSC80618.1 hypothetical protein OHA56_32190 [Streptomyces virginiae]
MSSKPSENWREACDSDRRHLVEPCPAGRPWPEREAAGESERASDPYDASVGYGLAAAFGTGAEPMWQLTLNAALDLWP